MAQIAGSEERRWLALSLFVATVIAACDVAIGPEDKLIGALVLGPLLASLRARPPATLAVTAYSLVLALLLGFANDFFLEQDHIVSTAPILIGGLLAAWFAALRTEAEASNRRYEALARAADMLQRERGIRHALQRVAEEVIVPGLASGCEIALETDDGTRTELVTAGEAAAGSGLLQLPLASGGRRLGSILFHGPLPDRGFEPQERELARDIASRCAVAIESAQLLERTAQAEAEVTRSRDQLRAILDGVADGVTAQDTAGRLVYANGAAVKTLGFDSPDELLAAPLEQVMDRFEVFDEDGRPFPLERLPGRRALAGERAAAQLVRFRIKATGEERWSTVKATPLMGAYGSVALVINVFEDMTEHMRREQAQRLLSETGKLLGSSLDYEETLVRIAQVCVPDLADWCLVDVLEEEEFRPVAIAHRDPDKLGFAYQLRNRYPLDPEAPAGPGNVIRTGQPELIPEVSGELLAMIAEDDDHLELLQRLGLASGMNVPLSARGKTFGVMSLASSESRRRFDADDFALAQEIAARCALAVDNARLFRERTYVAQTLQQSLLPPTLPSLPRMETAARFRAAGSGYEVGGDFYDLFQARRDVWVAVIGDVCGKGPEAAALTAMARYTVRATTFQETGPARVLAALNDAIIRQRTDRRFCTAAFLTLEIGEDRARVRVSSGGHPLPLVVRAKGGVEEIGRPGTLLGVVPDVELHDDMTELGVGDVLVLYTDGLTDSAAPDRILGTDDLARILSDTSDHSADGIAQALEDAALEQAQPRDDIAVLVLRMVEQPAANLVSSASGPATEAGRNAP